MYWRNHHLIILYLDKQERNSHFLNFRFQELYGLWYLRFKITLQNSLPYSRVSDWYYFEQQVLLSVRIKSCSSYQSLDMTHREQLNSRLGGDVTNFLFNCIKDGRIGKDELRTLASLLKGVPIYKAYKDRDPFDDKVAINLLTDLLDKESVTQLALSENHKESFSGLRTNFLEPKIRRSCFWTS